MKKKQQEYEDEEEEDEENSLYKVPGDKKLPADGGIAKYLMGKMQKEERVAKRMTKKGTR